MRPQLIPLTQDPWPAGPAMVRDLVAAVVSHSTTACGVEQARRATEIGFAIHTSHLHTGARVALPLADRTLSIPSFPWGNE